MKLNENGNNLELLGTDGTKGYSMADGLSPAATSVDLSIGEPDRPRSLYAQAVNLNNEGAFDIPAPSVADVEAAGMLKTRLLYKSLGDFRANLDNEAPVGVDTNGASWKMFKDGITKQANEIRKKAVRELPSVLRKQKEMGKGYVDNVWNAKNLSDSDADYYGSTIISLLPALNNPAVLKETFGVDSRAEFGRLVAAQLNQLSQTEGERRLSWEERSDSDCIKDAVEIQKRHGVKNVATPNTKADALRIFNFYRNKEDNAFSTFLSLPGMSDDDKMVAFSLALMTEGAREERLYNIGNEKGLVYAQRLAAVSDSFRCYNDSNGATLALKGFVSGVEQGVSSMSDAVAHLFQGENVETSMNLLALVSDDRLKDKKSLLTPDEFDKLSDEEVVKFAEQAYKMSHKIDMTRDTASYVQGWIGYSVKNSRDELIEKTTQRDSAAQAFAKDPAAVRAAYREGYSRFNERYTEKLSEGLSVPKFRDDEWGKEILYGAGSVIGYMAPVVAASALTGFGGAAIVGAATTGFLSGYGEMLDYTIDGITMTQDEARAAGLLYGGFEAAIFAGVGVNLLTKGAGRVVRTAVKSFGTGGKASVDFGSRGILSFAKDSLTMEQKTFLVKYGDTVMKRVCAVMGRMLISEGATSVLEGGEETLEEFFKMKIAEAVAGDTLDIEGKEFLKDPAILETLWQAFHEGVLYTPFMRAAFGARRGFQNVRELYSARVELDGKSIMTSTKDKLLTFIGQEERARSKKKGSGSNVRDNLSRRFVLASEEEREKLRKQARFTNLSGGQKSYIETMAQVYDEMKNENLREDFAETIVGGRGILGEDGTTRYNLEEATAAQKYISAKGALLFALTEREDVSARINELEKSESAGEELELARETLKRIEGKIEQVRKVISDASSILGGRNAFNIGGKFAREGEIRSVVVDVYKKAKEANDKERIAISREIADFIGVDLEERQAVVEATEEQAPISETETKAPEVSEEVATAEDVTVSVEAEEAPTPVAVEEQATEQVAEAPVEEEVATTKAVPVEDTAQEVIGEATVEAPAVEESVPVRDVVSEAKKIAAGSLEGVFSESAYMDALKNNGLLTGDVDVDTMFAKMVLLDVLFKNNHFGDSRVSDNYVVNMLKNLSPEFADALIDSAWTLARLDKTDWGGRILSSIADVVESWDVFKSITQLDAIESEDVYIENMIWYFSKGTPEGLKNYFNALLALNAFGVGESQGWWNGAIAEDIPFIAHSLTEKFRGTALADFVQRLTSGDPFAMEEISRLLAEKKQWDVEEEEPFSPPAVVETLVPVKEQVSKAVNSERVSAPTIEQIEATQEPVDAKEQFVEKVVSLLGVEKLNVISLRKLKDSFGLNELNDIEMQELVELAIVRKARGIIESGREEGLTRKEIFAKIVALYEAQPTISMRSSGRIEKQQYSTPIPMAYVADEFIMRGMSDSETPLVLEPSAGNGMMVIGIPQKFLHVNDIDQNRRDNLNRQSFAKVSGQDALVPFSMRYDAIVTNPPFGKLGKVDFDGYKIGGLERRMALNALASLKDGGRAAIIIGGNTEYAENGSLKRADDKVFFNYLYSHYNVADVINVDGGLYSRQGTSYPTRMILIDGRKQADGSYAPVKSAARAEVVSSFDDLFERVENARVEASITTDVSVGDLNKAIVNSTLEEKLKEGPVAFEDLVSIFRGNADVERKKPTKKSKKEDATPVVEEEASAPVQEVPAPVEETPAPVEEVSTQIEEQVVRKNREDAPIDLGTEKVAYPVQSFGTEIGSVVPVNMAAAVRGNLRGLGDVDAFVADKLGYNSREELYAALSAEQIDGVAMAIAQLEKERGASKETGKRVNFGFINGDMTGVGKGRQAAAIIRYAVRQGMKPVFVTEKAALFSDIYRDLRDIGSADLVPFIFNNNATANITDETGKVIYKHASAAELSAAAKKRSIPDKAHFICTTYSQFNSERTAEKRKLLSAVSKNSILIMDESHNASGESNTGMFFLDVVENARGVAFFSGTFAKRPDNMPLYASVTNLSAAGLSKEEMVEAVKNGGVPLQEIMSEELVRSGQMIRRERDMTGVTIDWIPLEKNAARLEQAYDEIIELFNSIIEFQNTFVKDALSKRSKELAQSQGLAGTRRGTDKMGVSNTPFASKTFNLVRQLMFALKAEEVAERAIVHAKNGLKPVVAVANTMEGFIGDEYGVGAEADSFDFTAALLPGLEGVLRYTEKDAMGFEKQKVLTPEELGLDGAQAYAELREKIATFSAGIPLSPIDEIKNRLREAGLNVAEMTGRKTEIVKTENGKLKVVPRTDRDGKKNARNFNNGGVDVLIINQSASTGISLHASSRVKDQRQRIMIFAQNQLDVNTEVQMRGRTDRTGQVHRSKYEYLVSNIPAEQRLLMMFKMKLKSLDANTTSSQKSKLNDMDVVDFMNVYGDEIVLNYLVENPYLVERLYLTDSFLKDIADSSDVSEQKAPEGFASKVLGRVALLQTFEQRAFYEEVADRYNAKIEEVNAAGENILEISELPLNAELSEERTVFIKGSKPDSDNPFAGNVYSEKLSVDVLTRPFSAREVEKAMQMFAADPRLEGRFTYGENGADYSKAVIAVWGEQDRKIIEERLAKIEEDGAYELKFLLAEAGNNPKWDTATDKVRSDLIASIKERFDKKQEERKLRVLKGVNGKFRSDQHVLINRLPIGQPVAIPDVLKPELVRWGTPYSLGMFLGWKFPKTGKIVPSSLRAQFAILDGRRKIEVPLSNVKLLEAITQLSAAVYRHGELDVTLDNWDSKSPKNTRETVTMLTGNILQGRGQVDAGKLVRFTMKSGERRVGIMMPKNWTPGKVASLASTQKDYIMSGEKVFSSDGAIAFQVRDGALRIWVPLSKQKGGKYFLNETIRGCVKGGEFMQQGSLMMATVLSDKVDDLLEVLSNDLSVRVLGKGEANKQARYQKAFTNAESSVLNPSTIGTSDVGLIVEQVGGFIPGVKVRIVESIDNENGVPLTDGVETFGFYNPVTKEVAIRENARIDTIVHELGWHATWDWAKTNAVELYEKLKEYARNAPEVVKAEVRSLYPELSEGSDAFLDEVGAMLFSSEHAGKVDSLLSEEKDKSWWAKIKRLFSRAWKAMLSAVGANNVKASDLAEKTFDEAVSALADAFVNGKTLTVGYASKNADSVMKRRNDTRVLFQKAAEEVDEVSAPKAEDWNKRFDDNVARILGFSSYEEMQGAWKRNLDEVIERSVIERARRNTALEKAKEASAHAALRKGSRIQDEKTRKEMARLRIPRFGSKRGGTEGWASNVATILRKRYSEDIKSEELDAYILGLIKNVVPPSYEAAAVNTLLTKDAMEVQSLIDSLLRSETLKDALNISLQIEKILAEKAGDKVVEARRKDLLVMLEKYGPGRFNSSKLIKGRKARGIDEFFIHELYQRNGDLENGDMDSFNEAVANAERDLKSAMSDEREKVAIARLNAARLLNNTPISKMGDAELLGLSEAITEVLTNGAIALEEAQLATKTDTRKSFGKIAEAIEERAEKHKDKRIADKAIRNVLRFAYTLRDKFDVLVGNSEEAREQARLISLRIAEADIRMNRMVAEDGESLNAAIGKLFGVPAGKVGMKEQALLCKRRDGSERFSLYGEKLTDGQLVSLYNQIRQIENKHLFADMTEEQVEKLDETAYKLYRQWQMKDELREFLGEKLVEFGKDVGRILYAHSAEIDAETYKDCGMPLSYKDSDEYFPIVRENELLDFMRDASIGEGNSIPVIPRFLTPRTHAYKPIDERADVMELFHRRSFDVANYVAHAQVNREIREFSNGKDYESARSGISTIMGLSFARDLSKHLRDIVSGQMPGADIYETAGNVVSTGLRRAMWFSRCIALGFNVTTGIKQAFGGFSSMGTHAGWDKMSLGSAILSPQKHIALAKELWESDGYKVRYGDASYQRMRTLGRWLTKHESLEKIPSSVVSTIVGVEQSSMVFTSWGDRIPMFAAASFYGYLKDKYYAQGLKGEEEVRSAAQAEFFSVYDQCQQAKSIQNLDAFSRGKNQFLKQQVQFVTAPLQMLSRLVKSFEDFVENPSLGNFRAFSNYGIYSFVLEPVSMFAAASFLGLVLPGGDDDELEFDSTQYILSSLSAVPLLGSAFEMVVGDRYSTSIASSPSAEIITRVLRRGKNVAVSLFDEEEGSTSEALDKLLRTSSAYSQVDKYFLPDKE